MEAQVKEILDSTIRNAKSAEELAVFAALFVSDLNDDERAVFFSTFRQ